MAIRVVLEKQPTALLFITMLPVVDALSNAGKITLVVAAVAATFVLTFAFLYYFASCCFSSSESDGNGNKIVLTDSDSDSTQPAEKRVIDTKSTNHRNEGEDDDDDSLTVDSGSKRESLWRSFSNRIRGSRSSSGRPNQDKEIGGVDAVPPQIRMDTSLDISLAISKLLSENKTKSFSAMAEAFVRSAAIADTLPQDDEVWSGYSGGSRLSVFDDSSCNTNIVRGHTGRELIPEEPYEEAWLEFVEVPAELEHSSSSLDIANSRKNRVVKCSVDL